VYHSGKSFSVAFDGEDMRAEEFLKRLEDIVSEAKKSFDERLIASLDTLDRLVDGRKATEDRLVDGCKATEDWLEDCVAWYKEASTSTENGTSAKMNMAACIAYRRALLALRKGKPGSLPIGLKQRREILMRKFGKII
jgi:hypothetical protein